MHGSRLKLWAREARSYPIYPMFSRSVFNQRPIFRYGPVPKRTFREPGIGIS